MTERGLVADILAAWSDLSGSIRAQMTAKPPESRLLAYLYIACLVGFVTGLPAAVRQAAGMSEEDALVAVVAGRLFAALFIAPLVFYGLAAAARLLCRAFAGGGSFYSSRVSLFWAFLVSTPLLIASGIATAFLPPGSGLLAGIQMGTTIVFLWVWATFLAETERFTRRKAVIVLAIGLMATILAVLLLFRLS